MPQPKYHQQPQYNQQAAVQPEAQESEVPADAASRAARKRMIWSAALLVTGIGATIVGYTTTDPGGT